MSKIKHAINAGKIRQKNSGRAKLNLNAILSAMTATVYFIDSSLLTKLNYWNWNTQF